MKPKNRKPSRPKPKPQDGMSPEVNTAPLQKQNNENNNNTEKNEEDKTNKEEKIKAASPFTQGVDSSDAKKYDSTNDQTVPTTQSISSPEIDLSSNIDEVKVASVAKNKSLYNRKSKPETTEIPQGNDIKEQSSAETVGVREEANGDGKVETKTIQKVESKSLLKNSEISRRRAVSNTTKTCSKNLSTPIAKAHTVISEISQSSSAESALSQRRYRVASTAPYVNVSPETGSNHLNVFGQIVSPRRYRVEPPKDNGRINLINSPRRYRVVSSTLQQIQETQRKVLPVVKQAVQKKKALKKDTLDRIIINSSRLKPVKTEISRPPKKLTINDIMSTISSRGSGRMHFSTKAYFSSTHVDSALAVSEQRKRRHEAEEDMQFFQKRKRDDFLDSLEEEDPATSPVTRLDPEDEIRKKKTEEKVCPKEAQTSVDTSEKEETRPKQNNKSMLTTPSKTLKKEEFYSLVKDFVAKTRRETNEDEEIIVGRLWNAFQRVIKGQLNEFYLRCFAVTGLKQVSISFIALFYKDSTLIKKHLIATFWDIDQQSLDRSVQYKIDCDDYSFSSFFLVVYVEDKLDPTKKMYYGVKKLNDIVLPTYTTAVEEVILRDTTSHPMGLPLNFKDLIKMEGYALLCQSSPDTTKLYFQVGAKDQRTRIEFNKMMGLYFTWFKDQLLTQLETGQKSTEKRATPLAQVAL